MERRVTNWRKSSASANGGEQCVEVGSNDTVLIRDTMDRQGVTLSVPIRAWTQFLSAFH
jgi:hypothetical protein